MRIECRDYESFLENLGSAYAVFLNRVHVDVQRVPLDNKPLRTSTLRDLTVQLSAVIIFLNPEDDSEVEVMLQGAHYCGVERFTANDDGHAKANLETVMQRVKNYCASKDLKILSGCLVE